MTNKQMEILLTAEKIDQKIRELAEEISTDYKGRKPLLVGVLKGAVVFLSDLIRHLKVPVKIDFIAVSSYGADTASSGIVRIQKDLDQSIKDKDVLIVEDIVDTGLTLNYLKRSLGNRRPRTLKVVALLDKPDRRKVEFMTDYCGFVIPDHFVVGYGLDFNENYRYLADICILSDSYLL